MTPEYYRRCSNDFRRLPDVAVQSAWTNQMEENLTFLVIHANTDSLPHR